MTEDDPTHSVRFEAAFGIYLIDALRNAADGQIVVDIKTLELFERSFRLGYFYGADLNRDE